MRPVAERLDLGAPAPAQGHLRPRGQDLAKPVGEMGGVGDEVRAVVGDLDLRGQVGLQAGELAEPLDCGCIVGKLDGEVLQSCGCLGQLRQVRDLSPELGRRPCELPDPVAGRLPGAPRLHVAMSGAVRRL